MVKKNELYLDDSATTRVDEKVVAAMKEFYIEEYGNPSSLHEKGEKAFEAMSIAREKLANAINARAWELYFTSGGTESDNWAIQGLATLKKNSGKKKIIISAIEHAAVVETCDFMKSQGYEIVKIKVDDKGLIDFDDLEKAIGDGKDVLIVSAIHVNNIIGVVQDIGVIGKLCKEKNVLFHTDVVQSFGKLEIDVDKMNIDLLSASAHKIGGPKGIGFLYVREGVKINPMIFGGGQEKNLRSGTENVPGIIGFAKALELEKGNVKERVMDLRDKLILGLEKIGGKVNGAVDENRIYNNVHVSFRGIESESLAIFLSEKGIYVSAGSACDSKKDKEDHVLKAIGLNDRESKGSIRITLNDKVNEEDIERVVSEIEKILGKFREVGG
jgi:cysteine desulfurase